jgi:ABC-2 type transport system ATP-binding protein
MPDIISIRDFSKSYGPVHAVDGLTFSVQEGQLFGIIGPDGAGKTTTMRTLVTLVPPDAGELRIKDLDVTKDSLAIRKIIGYMPQRFSLYPDLSVNQNLDFFADLFEVPKNEIAARKERLFRFSKLAPFRSRLAGRLSGGMKQKLALSCTLIHNPTLLVLDEPTTGVDPVSRNEFWAILHELTSEGVSILVSTPYMDEALQCDRIVIMHEGRVLAEGDPRALPAQFGHRLFALYERDLITQTLTPQTIPGVLSVQSFGDSLHLTVAADSDQDTLTKNVAAAINRPVKLTPIEPSLEDLFISIIGERTHG